MGRVFTPLKMDPELVVLILINLKKGTKLGLYTFGGRYITDDRGILCIISTNPLMEVQDGTDLPVSGCDWVPPSCASRKMIKLWLLKVGLDPGDLGKECRKWLCMTYKHMWCFCRVNKSVGPNRKALFQTHLTLHGLICPHHLNFNIRWSSSPWLIPVTTYPKKLVIIVLFWMKCVQTIQDYCITLTTRNSTQINTSRQCMLKLTCVSTDWHVSHVFMVHTGSSIFVSDVLTLYAHWLVPTSKVIMLYIWLPKTEFMPICFCLNFSICGCE